MQLKSSPSVGTCEAAVVVTRDCAGRELHEKAVSSRIGLSWTLIPM